MDYFLYSVELPFSKKEIYYRELKTKEQLVLCKANAIFPIEDDSCVDYSRILQNIISNCVENKEDFISLNLIDYFLFMIKLRIISIGNEIELVFKEDKKENELTKKIILDLNSVLLNLYNASSEILGDGVILYKNVSIALDWPNIKSEFMFLKHNDMNNVIYTIPEYIKEIKIGSNVIEVRTLKSEQKVEVFDKLPVALRAKIQDRVLEMIKNISSKNIFLIKDMDGIKFNFYNRSHQGIFRLLFSTDLKSVYQQYYILAQKKIDPNYVDNLAISERRVFCSMIEEENKVRQNIQMDEQMGGDGSSMDLQDLMDEFGG
jgi:hypothetical protein